MLFRSSVKFIFATNRDPAQLVSEGKFQADVLARIGTRVDVPPLRERPEDIPLLVRAHRADPQALIIGSRLHDRANIPLARYLANRCANFWIAWAAGQPIADSQSGFRVYPAALLRAFVPRALRDPGFVFESEILIEAGRRGTALLEVPIAAIYPERARRSHFRPVLDIARITRMVAWKLFSRGFYLSGLIRSLQRNSRNEVARHAGGGGEVR